METNGTYPDHVEHSSSVTSLSPSTTLQRPFALTGYTFGAFTPAFALPTRLVLAATGHAARTLACFTPSSF